MPTKNCNFSLIVAEYNRYDQQRIKLAVENVSNRIDCRFIEDGTEVLSVVKDSTNQASKSRPNLLLLELMMPKLSGFHILQYIKSTQHLREIPIVVLSHFDDQETINTCYQLGANSYMVKSREQDLLTEQVEALLHYWACIAIECPGIKVPSAIPDTRRGVA